MPLSDGVVLSCAAFIAASVTHRLLRNSTPAPNAAIIGGLSAGFMLWLVGQRDDIGSALVLGAFAGIGVGLAFSLVARFVVRAGVDTSTPALTRSRRRPRVVAGVCAASVVFAGGYIGGSTVDASWFGGGITHGDRRVRMVALTFDDGPNRSTTPAIMKLLDDANVQGTFFMVGKALDQEPAIAQTLLAHGHLLANHSYDHDQWRWLDPRYPELERTQAAFQRNHLPCPYWYRPPHGQRTPFVSNVVDDHHMGMAMWDVSAGDWATTNAHLIARRVLTRVEAGSIVVLHDGLDGIPTRDRSVLARALPEILAGLKTRGLQPVRLDQLLHTPATVPCKK